MNYAGNSPQRRSSARRQHAMGGLETKVDVLRDPEAERTAFAEILLLQFVLEHLAEQLAKPLARQAQLL